MGLLSVDIGFVSPDGSVIDFYAAVFELPEIEALQFSQGTVRRLQGPGGVIKAMIPADRPAPPPPADTFYAVAGLRYLTARVDDLDAVIGRVMEHGGEIVLAPVDSALGVRIAIVRDPEGNVVEIMQTAK